MISRRSLFGISSLLGAAWIGALEARANTIANHEGALTPPSDRRLRVAFLIGRRANPKDTVAAWEVFSDSIHGLAPNMNNSSMADHYPEFETYTVSDVSDPVLFNGGMRVQPKYTVADAPQPDIVVVPTHVGNDATNTWLRSASDHADVVMAVCTGTYNLAEAGLLNGRAAMIHHYHYEAFAQQQPQVRLVRGKGFLYDGKFATSSSATYGAQLAMNVVKRYFGTHQAGAVADYLQVSERTWDV